MYLISYGCSVSIHQPAAFRVAWGLQAVPGAVLFASLFFFPESPRWLASKDRWEECHDVLANLHAKGDRDNIEVMAELEEAREAARVAVASREIGYLGLVCFQYVEKSSCRRQCPSLAATARWQRYALLPCLHL